MDKTSSDREVYCAAHSHGPSALAQDLAEFTRKNVEMSIMLSGPVVMSMLVTLVRSPNVQRVLEVGTFTGYSALIMAEHLPPDGTVTTLDINPQTVEIGKTYWAQSPHGQKITSLIGPAAETFRRLEGNFDLVFIDADKPGYGNYVELALARLNPGGIIVCDNTLYQDKVLDPNTTDQSARSLQKFNASLAARIDLWVTQLPVSDGLTLIQKRAEEESAVV